MDKNRKDMGVGVGLAVRVPQRSLFHDEKFAFFDFGVRGTPKILIIFLGVPPKILKNLGVSTPVSRRPAIRGCDLPAKRVSKPPTFYFFFGGTPKKIIKILGVPLIPKVIKMRIYSEEQPPIDTYGLHDYLNGTMVQWQVHMECNLLVVG